jgi:hypothetical protein
MVQKKSSSILRFLGMSLLGVAVVALTAAAVIAVSAEEPKRAAQTAVLAVPRRSRGHDPRRGGERDGDRRSPSTTLRRPRPPSAPIPSAPPSPVVSTPPRAKRSSSVRASAATDRVRIDPLDIVQQQRTVEPERHCAAAESLRQVSSTRDHA